MRFGYWMPVFGGWLRNVEDEGMEASWDYVRRLTLRSEETGWDLSLIAELNLNDIKGVEEPALDAWSTAAALAAVTERIELMVAVRPNFHQPALFAKQAANIDNISGGRLSLNVVSSWWADEATQYGLQFDRHDDRYGRTGEWLDVVDGLWTEKRFTHEGERYRLKDAICEPKPVSKPRPTIYAGGESEAAKTMIADRCDAYVMHGDPVEAVAPKIADMAARREQAGRPGMRYGMAAYAIVRDSEAEAERELERITALPPEPPKGFDNFDQWLSGTQLERELKLREYSVSNRGLRPNLVGTPEQLRERIEEYEAAGLDLLLLQMSPQAEEMDRFAAQVIAPMKGDGHGDAVRNDGVSSDHSPRRNRMTDEVRNNESEHRYELEVEGQLAIAAYRLRDGRITFTHTEVPDALEGRGIGSRLIKAALDDARSKGLKVVPACPFVKHYMDKHPETQDLLA